VTEATRDRIPAHLRRFVVDQDYGAYDEIDQAVWRFVLLQTYDRLKHTAHPAYVDGLAQTGISVERIPRIEEMDACLSRFGWGAVVVDGFIPPRAFQEFQAHRIMTIAAAIRRRKHLAYTPAPDIIHESAGHAPIVPDPDYAAFLSRFGEIGRKAFSSREDIAVYEAIRHLSEVKEDRDSTPERIAAAERALESAQAKVSWTTEAAFLSRLHWWTVEYGLVGTPQDYKIYGAGLLSSLGESTSCHRPQVRKIPLSVDCIQVDYDITKPQPQLFVARDFAHLGEVLEEFAGTLAQRRGGAAALAMMHRAGELGTVELSSGLQVTGVLGEIVAEADEAAYLRLTGPCALAHRDRILEGHGPARHGEGFGMPLGRLEDGADLADVLPHDLSRYEEAGRLRLRYRSGVEIEGVLDDAVVGEDGRLLVVSLRDAAVRRGPEILFDPAWGPYDLAVGGDVRACFAGPADLRFHPATDFPEKKVPRPKDPATAAEEGRVLHLYREALQLWEDPQAPDLVERFAALDEKLAAHPDEWLLRWNLLECLRKLDRGEELQQKLRHDLLEIEKGDYDELPITTGLKYLQMA
jgi:phenylalanine-4-hydroxylase